MPSTTQTHANGTSELSTSQPDGLLHGTGSTGERSGSEAIQEQGVPEMHAVAGVRHLNLDEAYRDNEHLSGRPAEQELPASSPDPLEGSVPDGAAGLHGG